MTPSIEYELEKKLIEATERAEKAEAKAMRICVCGGMVSGPLDRPCDHCGSTEGELVQTAWFNLKAENARLMELIKQLSEAHQTGEATDSEWTEMWTGVHQIARGEKAIATERTNDAFSR